MKSCRRILVAPVEIAGQYRNLCIAIRESGRKCDYHTFYSHPFQYGLDLGPCPIPGWMRAIHAHGKAGSTLARCMAVLAFELLRILFFFYALIRYDGFIFGFGLSLLRYNYDLPVLRLFGKRVVANLSHGSEMTPDYLDGALLSSKGVMPSSRSLIQLTKTKLRNVRKFEKYASSIIGSPLSSSYLSSKPYVSIFAIGRVCQSVKPCRSDPTLIQPKLNRPVRLLHVPSHAPGKGTHEIEQILDSLRNKGVDFDYQRLTDVPNNLVLSAILQCDLVVDQLYADLPMSGLACEAALLGKPTLVGGYELMALRDVVPSDWFPPTLISHPQNFEQELERLVGDPSLLLVAGQKLRHFVLNQWKPESVSRRYLYLLDSKKIPSDWMHTPSVMLSTCGYGLSSNRLINSVRQILVSYGPEALCLAHRPDLQNALCALANSSQSDP